MGHFRRITMNDGKLGLSWAVKGAGYPFEALSSNEFVRYTKSGYPYLLKFDSVGSGFQFTESFVGSLPNQKDWVFKKTNDSPFDIEDFLGTYKDKQHQTKIKIRKNKDKIFAKKSIIKIPLIRLEDDCFYSPEYEVLLLFQRNTAGEIEALKINAEDFRNFNMWKEKL